MLMCNHVSISDDTIIDFCAFGYLGLRHRADELRPWNRLSGARPATLEDDELAWALEQQVAALLGCESAVFGPSTLHIFWDLFSALSNDDVAVYLDDDVYPIARWGIERVQSQGVSVHRFSHHNPAALCSLLKENLPQLERPVVVADGVSSRMWSTAPLRDYAACIEPFGGLLIVDDTQATGLLGHSPGPQAPFGVGGGGSLRWHELESSSIILVSSLTKGFGIPVAVLSGSAPVIDWFRANSQTRLHCSPPSNAALHAVEHALDVNELRGDELRARLAENIRRFQAIFWDGDAAVAPPFFPIQVVPIPETVDPVRVNAELLSCGLRVLLQHDTERSTNLLLVITAEHELAEVSAAASLLRKTIMPSSL